MSNFQAMMAKVEEAQSEAPKQEESLAAQVAVELATEPEETQDEAFAADEQDAAQDESAADEQAEQESTEPEVITDDKGKKLVNYGALKEERDQRRKERDERIRVETENEALKRALEMALKMEGQGGLGQSPASQNAALEIDPLDPDAHNFYTQQLEGISKKVDAKFDEFTQKMTETQVIAQVAQQRADFAAKTPDFGDAVAHIFNAERQKSLYFGLTEQQATENAKRVLGNIGTSAVMTGKNAAASLYEVAKHYGYQKKAPAKQTGPDISAIARNKAKSEGIANVPGVGASAASGPNPMKSKADFAKAVCDEHGRVDTKKLMALYGQIERQSA